MDIKDSIKNIISRFGLNISRVNEYPELIQYINPTLVLDVGANMGQFASKIRKLGYKNNILSFEPVTSAYDILCDSAALDPHWQIYERCALGATKGTLTINQAGNSVSSSIKEMLPSHSSVVAESKYVGQELVKVMPLDECLDLFDLDKEIIYLKIDTQGFEKEVLEGCKQSLSSINAVQIELSIVELYKDQELFQYFFDYFQYEGFKMWDLLPGFRNLKTGQLLQFDALFLRDS